MDNVSSKASSRQRALDILQALDYDQPTPLQLKALDCDEFFSNRNMLVIGQTSSGKTLVPLLAYYELLVRAGARGPAPKLLFVVPYRALAAQKLKEITEDVARLRAAFDIPSMSIEQSTGEFRQADDQIMEGSIDIAVIITEKAFNFAAGNASFLARYDVVVVDEVGLVDEKSRGTRLDFLLMWANAQHRRTGKARLFALATPSFSWGRYIDSFGFVSIVEQARPIVLKESMVTISKGNIFCRLACDGDSYGAQVLPQGRLYYPAPVAHFEDEGATFYTPCEQLGEQCPIRTPCRSDARLTCPRIGRSCASPALVLSKKTTARFLALEFICRHHLALGHQIIIFINDREEVRRTCKWLFAQLADILDVPQDGASCQRELLDACHLTADDLFGIMEDVDEDASPSDTDVFYRAFSAGIAFHSRAMPNELRSYVEERLLEGRSMKVVCSTETLAYGVNSAVDVVVVADLHKPSNEAMRPLTANEYRNYTGRAGRLRRDRSGGEGFVYTLVRDGERDVEALDALSAELADPKRLSSNLYSHDADGVPLFILNLIHASGSTVTSDEILQMARSLPIPLESRGQFYFKLKVEKSLRMLCQEGLVALERDPFEGTDEWGLTPLGEELCGNIVTWSDYQLLKRALAKSFRGMEQPLEVESLLSFLLEARHLQSSLPHSFGKDETLSLDRLRAYYVRRCGRGAQRIAWLAPLWHARKVGHAKPFFLLAALLQWSEGHSSKELVREFGVQYPVIQAIGQQLDYLLGIMGPLVRKVVSEEIRARKLTATPEELDACVERLRRQLHQLSISLYYGIDGQIRERLLVFLDTCDEEGAPALATRVADQLDPDLARTLRRCAVRDLFFSEPPLAGGADVETRNNYRNQRQQYLQDIHAMGPLFEAFFAAEHPETFGATR